GPPVTRTDVILIGVFTAVGCREHALDPSAPEVDLTTARCIGPADAKRFAVYLHGADAPALSDQEVGNRRTLAQIAKELSIRIALPRASSTCPNQPGSVCWGWTYNDAERTAAVTAIDAAAAACFPTDRRFVLIGFSNGGYLLEKLFRTCELPSRVPRATSVVT